MQVVVLALLLAASTEALGYIHSVPAMVKAVFEKRDPEAAVEAVFRHRIGRSSRMLREQVYSDGKTVLVSWGMEGAQGTVRARVTEGQYEIGGQRSFKRESRILLDYLTGNNSEQLLASLLDEKFVRRDQLMEFKPDYRPSGPPKSWRPGQHYIKHDDIFLKQLDKSGVVVAVLGMNDGLDRRTVYFDRGLRGIARLEWREEGRITAWNFDHFKKTREGAYFPRRMSLTQGDVEVISSEIVSIQPMKKTDWEAIKRSYASNQSADIPSDVEESLESLLRFR